eukprot:1156319-Pelagomonas_calceolata.AAC.24
MTRIGVPSHVFACCMCTQEPDQLRSAVRYIASLGTELLVVEKSVARAAQVGMGIPMQAYKKLAICKE